LSHFAHKEAQTITLFFGSVLLKHCRHFDYWKQPLNMHMRICYLDACWFHVLYCSDYPPLFRLDPVTTAIWLVSFGLIILSILHWTMVYFSSVHNNLDSLWQKFLYSL
jgi:hypothetical protein